MGSRVRVAVMVCLVCFAVVQQSRVLHADPAQVVVGWTLVPGLMQRDENGRLTGFMIDLARLLAEEAGLDLRLEEYDSVPALLDAQANGRSEMLAGVADLPSLRGSSHYSQNVGQVAISVLHRSGDSRLRTLDSARGLRLAGVRGAAGTELTGPLLRNEFLTYGSDKLAFEALLTHEVDGVVGPQDALSAIMAAKGMGTQVKLLAKPFRYVPRMVALHRGRTDLRSQIDAAVVALEDDGRLAQLRLHWGIASPTLAPKVLIAGVLHAPPYTIVQADGTFSGFAVDALTDLAERAGQELRFVAISSADWRDGPTAGRYDLLPLEPISPARAASLDFGLPLLSVTYSIFLRGGTAPIAWNRIDWAGKRLGVLARDHDLLPLVHLAGAERVVFGSVAAQVAALNTGDIDALLADRLFLSHSIAELDLSPNIQEAKPPLFDVEQAIAVRADVPEVMEVLNAATPGYLASPRYHELRLFWIHAPTAWTTQQLAKVLGGIGAFAVLLAGGIGWRHYLRRLRDARRDIAEDLIDKIPLGLVLLSRDGRIKYFNRETARTGASLSGFLAVGKHYSDALRGLVAAGRADLGDADPEQWIAAQIQDVQVDGREVEVRTADGVTFLRTTKRLKDGETLLLRRDVTEERARLCQIHMLNDDLQDQIRLANAATEDLRAFAYATSHDLKAPTNTALMIASALREDLEQGHLPDTAEMLDDLETTLDGMQTLIEDVRAYTDAIATLRVAMPVDIGAETQAAIDAMSAEIRVSAAQITRSALPQVTGSPAQIRALLSNLIENAIKFRSPDRPLRLRIGQVEAPEGTVAVAVADNGIGIDPCNQTRIFQLFQRLNPASDFSGSGLGLAICQRIALNHGGRVTVSSRLGVGSTFTVSLRKDPQ